MHAIIGLGNPGRQYQKTRHNIGYLVVDNLLSNYHVSLIPGKGNYYYSEFEIEGKRIIVIKPTTYMNMSGIAVKQIVKYYSVYEQDLLVIHDDFHLPFGTLRFRTQGSDAGHNGIKSIIYELGTDAFNRLRFGIGNDFYDASEFVLSKFTKNEMNRLNDLIEVTVESINYWCKYGINKAMSNYNKAFI